MHFFTHECHSFQATDLVPRLNTITCKLKMFAAHAHSRPSTSNICNVHLSLWGNSKRQFAKKKKEQITLMNTANLTWMQISGNLFDRFFLPYVL